MAAKPKLTPGEWAKVRATWEGDPREGYAWLVEDLSLPVSAPGVRKMAVKDGWVKSGATAPVSKNKVSKVSQGSHAKVSETIKETITETMTEVVAKRSGVGSVKSGQGDESVLTAKEERFVSEYLVDLNCTAAYKRVFPHVTDGSANTLGARLLGKVRVSAAVEAAKAKRAARTEINSDRALTEAWAVATADPRELVQVKVGCCRHCHGEGHQYQWTVGEMNREKEKHVASAKDIADFDEKGGIGFDPSRPPNPDCPDCGGDGTSRTVLMDTRNLSPQAAALYAGAKQTKYGIEIQMHSKSEALDKVFRHLGLYEKEKEININVFPPREVLDAIYTKALSEAAERDSRLAGRRERLGIVFDNGGEP